MASSFKTKIAETLFLFDLDGTVTEEETLPLIAKNFPGIKEDIEALTKDTIEGKVPFIESFIKRVNVLGKLPVSQIRDLITKTKLNSHIASFIVTHPRNCRVITQNLDCWVVPLLKRLGCAYFVSTACVKDDHVIRLDQIINKEQVTAQCRRSAERVVFIGEGNNDAQAMMVSDISIAFGGVHPPSRTVRSVATHAVYSAERLCTFLKQLL